MPPEIDCPICGQPLSWHSGMEIWLCSFMVRSRAFWSNYHESMTFAQSVREDIESL